MSGPMKSIIAATALTGLASAHSWVHCTDYRGDTVNYEPDQCFGNPRPLDGKVPGMTPFGVDTGFNQQPGANGCHSTEAQHPSYPMAHYQRGQPITLAWPAKNHVAATCTNQWIPDTALELFVTEEREDRAWMQVPASFSDDKHVNGQMDLKGFQNCANFCNDMDKALCTGRFIVPDGLSDGKYTFQWRWEFNPGTPPYVTCFEAEVKGDFDGVIPLPPTPPPTEEAVAPSPQQNCGGEWSQCGGSAQSYDCCEAGLTCFKKDNWYSQCRPSCPNDNAWECHQGAQPVVDVAACTSDFKLGDLSSRLAANDATECWNKCQRDSTCSGWEFEDGQQKPCTLYKEVATITSGLRNCHPTQGLQ